MIVRRGMRSAIVVAAVFAVALLSGSPPARPDTPPPPPPPPACAPDLNEPNDDFASATPIASAAPAAIDPQTDVDFYVVTLSSPALLSIGAISSSGQPFRVDLFDGRQTLIASGTGTLGQTVQAGEYFVRVSGASVGCYILQFTSGPPPPPPSDPYEPNDDFATATAIALPFLGGACIDPQTDVDFFTFSGQNGATLSVTAGSTTGQLFRLDLFDEQGDLVASGTRTLQRLLATGRYFLRISADITGCYSLQISEEVDPFEPNDDFATATPISLPFFGTTACINPQADVDVYTFLVPQGADLTASAGGASGQTLRLELFDAGQSLVATGSGGPSGAVLDPAPAGIYFLRVSADAAGCYDLSVTAEVDRFEPNNDFATATAIALPFGGDARIDPATDVDFYTFSVPDAVSLSVLTTGSGRFQCASGLRLDLFDARQALVASGTDGLALDVAAGRYFLRVSAGASPVSTTGCYTLLVSAAAPPPPPPPPADPFEPNNDLSTASPIEPNLRIPSSAALTPGDLDYYRFDAAAGSELQVTAMSPDVATLVALFDAQGRIVTSGPAIRLRLESAGTYFLGVTTADDPDFHGASGQGAYALSILLYAPHVLASGHSLEFLPQMSVLVAVDPDTGALVGLTPPLVPFVVPIPGQSFSVLIPALTSLRFAHGFGGADLLATDTLGRAVAVSATGTVERIFADTRGGLLPDLALFGDRLFVSTGLLPSSPAIASVDATGRVSGFLQPPALSSQPVSLAVSPDGRTLYYSDLFSGDLVRVDVATATEIGRAPIAPPLTFMRLAVDPSTGDVYAAAVEFQSFIAGGALTFPQGTVVRWTPETGEVQTFADGLPFLLALDLTFGPCAQAPAPQEWCLYVPGLLGIMKFDGFHGPPVETAIAYTGDRTGDFHDAVTLAAELTAGRTHVPLPNARVDLTLGSQSCSGLTDPGGRAACTLTLDQPPGRYPVSASFGGNADYLAAADSSGTFDVRQEESTTRLIGPRVFLRGAVSLAGRLLEDGSVPIAGRALTLSLGSQSCIGLTNTDGVATCGLTVTTPLGPQPLGATFAGDPDYLPSSDTGATAIVFAFPSQGAFVVGDASVASASPTTSVTWWGDTWSTLNSLSGGPVSASFKGFAASPTPNPPACGATWTSAPGNSSAPVATVPSYMGAIVARSITQSDRVLAGNVVGLVVIRTDPGYAPDPSHPGTGTIVASICSGNVTRQNSP